MRQIREENPTSEIIVLDAFTYAANPLVEDQVFRPLGISSEKCDLTSPERVARLLDSSTAVIHLAASSHVDRSIAAPYSIVKNNVTSTVSVLEAIRQASPSTPLVIVSTDEVYGSISEGSWTETSNLNPNSPYSSSKAASDLIGLSYARTFDLDVRITRCCNNYGPYQHPEKLIPRFITLLLKGERVPLYGTGSNVREWIHVEDHCRGILSALSHGDPGRIYHFGTRHEFSNMDITKEILRCLRLDEDRIEHVSDRLGHDMRYSLDSSWTSERLGWVPMRSLKQDLELLINWYRENEVWVQAFGLEQNEA